MSRLRFVIELLELRAGETQLSATNVYSHISAIHVYVFMEEI